MMNFNLSNPLRSHYSKRKIGAFYYVIDNLHKSHKSCLKAVQVSTLLRATDMKYFGWESILKPLINDC